MPQSKGLARNLTNSFLVKFFQVQEERYITFQRGRRRGGRRGSCPPTFESWGAQPLQFFTCYARPLLNSPPLFSTCSYPSAFEVCFMSMLGYHVESSLHLPRISDLQHLAVQQLMVHHKPAFIFLFLDINL